MQSVPVSALRAEKRTIGWKQGERKKKYKVVTSYRWGMVIVSGSSVGNVDQEEKRLMIPGDESW